MNVRLFVLERWLPGWVRRRMLHAIAELTAEAFGAEPPRLARLDRHEAVASFAAFTRSEAERVLADGHDPARVSEIRGRLHGRARAAGEAAARRLGVATRADAFRALRLLYRGIGVEMDADADTGGVTVRRCLFSAVYTPEVCDFISALDAGFVSGITGGGTLEFSERITGGAPCCLARVTGGARP